MITYIIVVQTQGQGGGGGERERQRETERLFFLMSRDEITKLWRESTWAFQSDDGIYILERKLRKRESRESRHKQRNRIDNVRDNSGDDGANHCVVKINVCVSFVRSFVLYVTERA